MSDYSLATMTTVTATTKRATLTGGYASYLAALKCTPLAPVDAETRQRLMLDTPHTIWEVYLQDNPDIISGDKFVVGSKEYYVKAVEPYTWLPSGDMRVRIILEDVL